MALDPNAVPAVAPVPAVTTAPVAPVSNTPYQTVMTPTQATQLVNQYGIDPTQVLSTANIQQTVKAPVPKPDDLLGIRKQLYAEGGVNTAQAAYQAAQQAASSATLGLSERLTALRGRPVSINKIVGQQAQERAVSQGEIDALNESARLAAADYAAKKGNADEMFQIRNQEISEKKQIMLQYPGAKITFGDSFATVTKKLVKLETKLRVEAKREALKNELIKLGKSTSGTTDQLRARLSKANKNALELANREAEKNLELLDAQIKDTFSTIANRGKTTSQEDALLDLKKRTMESDLATQELARKTAQQELDYNQQQIDAAKEPGFWESVWNWF